MELIPYLIFDGSCEEALGLYARALGGSLVNVSRYGDAPSGEGGPKMAPDKIMHATLQAGSLLLMASDGPQGNVGDANRVHLSVNHHSEEEQTRVFNTLSEGASITMPLQDTFWGARFGMLTDKFGVSWMFNYDKPKN